LAVLSVVSVALWDGMSARGVAGGGSAAGSAAGTAGDSADWVAAIGDGSSAQSATTPTPEGLVYVGEYRNNLYDPETGMSLFWQNNAANLYVGLITPGTGWLGVGFSARPGKPGANIILGAVADGTVTIQDNYGLTRELHLPDKTSSILAFGGSEEPGETTLEFVIPLSSGDPQDVTLSAGQTVYVLLAYQATRDSFTVEHTRYSTTQITLDP